MRDHHISKSDNEDMKEIKIIRMTQQYMYDKYKQHFKTDIEIDAELRMSTLFFVFIIVEALMDGHDEKAFDALGVSRDLVKAQIRDWAQKGIAH